MSKTFYTIGVEEASTDHHMASTDHQEVSTDPQEDSMDPDSSTATPEDSVVHHVGTTVLEEDSMDHQRNFTR